MSPDSTMISEIFLRFLERIERKISYWQGVGFGYGSIDKEVGLATSSLNCSPTLVVDIGGHRGVYSDSLLKRFPAAELHIFEPSLYNYKLITHKFSNYKNVHINKLCVSDLDGDTVLYSDKDGSSLASLSPRRLDHFGIKFSTEEKVKSVRFEGYWKEKLNQRVIDLVKIDIEGHEILALKGFGESLPRIRVLQFEFGGCNIDSRTYFQDFFYFFKENNFKINRITPFGLFEIKKYSESDERFITTNYIAVNQKPSL